MNQFYSHSTTAYEDPPAQAVTLTSSSSLAKNKQVFSFGNKRILVTGGDGTLASRVKELFPKSKIALLGKRDLDVTKIKQIEKAVQKNKPDLIMHFAALTDVDFCEKHPQLAKEINFIGTQNIAEICQKYNIPLVYISTATVFDGKNPQDGGFTENDIPSPINVYGKTKLLGEQVVQKLLKKYIIVRIGWLIGGGKKDKFFVSYMSKKIKKGGTIHAVNNIYGTIAHAKDLMQFIKSKLEKEEFGLYHFACKGKCSRFDMATVMAKILNPSAKIIPVNSYEFSSKFPAQRPQYQLIKSVKHSFEKPWDLVLKEYITKELLA